MLPPVKYLEKPFNLKLTADDGRVYTIRGVIDRIDEGAGGAWNIIDYKTGRAKDALDWDSKMQLLIYQLAAQELYNTSVEKLTYVYLDEDTALSFLGTEKDLEKLRAELIAIITALQTSKFAATPGIWCQFCDFRSICEFKE